jgi:RNA polymerase sigma factor (sigma-70 family)
MKDTPDAELLRRYAEDRDHAAFTEMVRRYINLAHAAALRQVSGDTHLANDVVQEVFSEVAAKARTLSKFSTPAPWIYTVTRNKALMARRTQYRWRKRELEANTMLEPSHDPTLPKWSELRPVLDETMHELGAADREVLVLHYFQGLTRAEISRRLGLLENTARMRMERALDRLRQRLARRGITSTAAALGTVLAGQIAGPAPAGLVALVSNLATAAPAASGFSGFLFEFIRAVTWQKLNTAAALALLAAVGVLLLENQAEAAMRQKAHQENSDLALLRGDLRLLQRTVQQLAAPEETQVAADPRTAALVRLGHLEAMFDRGTLDRGNRVDGKGPFVFFSGIFKEGGIPQGNLVPGTAAVFGLSEAESAAMQQAYTEAKNAIDVMAWEAGMLKPGKQRWAAAPLKPTVAMEEAHQRMRQAFQEILGTELYRYYVLFGCEAREEKLLFGIGEHLGVQPLL